MDAGHREEPAQEMPPFSVVIPSHPAPAADEVADSSMLTVMDALVDTQIQQFESQDSQDTNYSDSEDSEDEPASPAIGAYTAHEAEDFTVIETAQEDSDCTTQSLRFKKTLGMSVGHLIGELIQLERTENSAIKEFLRTSDTQTGNKATDDFLTESLLEIICGTFSPIVEAIAFGNLEVARLENPAVAKELDRMLHVAHQKQPSIYCMSLVNVTNGHAPTANELKAMVELAERYSSSAVDKPDRDFGPTAYEIDKWMDASKVRGEEPALHLSENGARRYLSQDGGCHGEPDLNRVARLDTLLSALRRRIAGASMTPENQDLPLLHPLILIGYTANLPKRFQMHAKHSSSNYLMNLFEAICAVRFPGQFCIRRRCIFNIYRRPQIVLAEIFLTRLAQGYTTNGGGFSHHIAGRNNLLRDQKSSEMWQEWLVYAREHTPFMTQLEAAVHTSDLYKERALKTINLMREDLLCKKADFMLEGIEMTRQTIQDARELLQSGKDQAAITDSLEFVLVKGLLDVLKHVQAGRERGVI